MSSVTGVNSDVNGVVEETIGEAIKKITADNAIYDSGDLYPTLKAVAINIERANTMLAEQKKSSMDGDYAVGAYNGMEAILAVIEGRPPVFIAMEEKPPYPEAAEIEELAKDSEEPDTAAIADTPVDSAYISDAEVEGSNE